MTGSVGTNGEPGRAGAIPLPIPVAPEQPRGVAVEAQLLRFKAGTPVPASACTVQVVRRSANEWWLFGWAVTADAVSLTGAQAREVGRALLGEDAA